MDCGADAPKSWSAMIKFKLIQFSTRNIRQETMSDVKRAYKIYSPMKINEFVRKIRLRLTFYPALCIYGPLNSGRKKVLSAVHVQLQSYM
uniref:Uncharacterized protein n=1 Tax=Romanomermis culicivorax TaxID=13658 RepID=A0A915ICE3_ROMCU